MFLESMTLSGCRDSNPESLAPKARMLAVTPHPDYFVFNIGILPHLV